jgi:uncharacterized protein (DUF1697 family)
METWVALLRGVNVGGVTIRNADLTEVLRALGHEDVRAVLASGNVVFRATGSAAELQAGIEAALRDRYGRDVPTVLVQQAWLESIVDAFPFPSAADRHDYVVFATDGEVLDAVLDGLVPGADEQVARGDHVLWWSCPKGSSTETPVAKRLAAARFRRTTTTRNVNTLRRLLWRGAHSQEALRNESCGVSVGA